MGTLQQAISAAGGPPLAGFPGLLARTLSVPPAPLPGGSLVAGTVLVSVASDATDVVVTIDLAGSTLSLPAPPGTHWESAPGTPLAGGAVLDLAGATLTLTVPLDLTPSTWTLSGATATVGASGLFVPVPGLATAGLRLSRAGGPGLELDLSITAGEPTVTLHGGAELVGVPGLTDGGADLTLTWTPAGLSGAVTAHPAAVAGADWSVGWRGHDLLPESLEVTVPFALDTSRWSDTAATSSQGTQLRVRGARTAGGLDLSAAIEAGDGGVVSTADASAALGTVLATALAATRPAGPTGAAGLAAMYAAAVAAVGSGVLAPGGVADQVVVTGARLDLAHPAQVGVDYDAVFSATLAAGPIQAALTRPMHVAIRDAVLRLDDPAGLALDLTRARIDAADTGTWVITSPSGLLDVAGVRSGADPTGLWVELDLRFALDLGPVEVHQGTVRVGLDPLAVGLRGLGVDLSIPGVVDGSGDLALTGGELDASVTAHIEALGGLGASAALKISSDPQAVLVALGVELPVPVPLASTGLGLGSVGALVGINEQAVFPAASDPKAQAGWNPAAPGSTKPVAGEELFGASLGIETLPDLGVTLSATGSVLVQVPDLAIRIAVDARVFEVLEVFGIVLVDATKPEVLVDVWAGGKIELGGFTVLEVSIPLEAEFTGSAWHLYLGTDGIGDRAAPGPMQVRVLPGLIDIGCEAFLMVASDGLPNVFGTGLDLGGFALATGFRYATTYGAVPVLYADVHVSAAVGIGTHPFMILGKADAGGSLHLGPFSLGVDVDLTVQVGPGSATLLHLHACGEIDLFFTSISGCVDLDIGASADPGQVAAPDDPLLSATLADPFGRVPRGAVVALTRTDAGAPVAWPDATVLLGFGTGPSVAGVATTFAGLGWHAPSGAGGLADQLTLDYAMTTLDLVRVDDGVSVASKLPVAWQRDPSAANAAAATLALLTTTPELWATELDDGGAGTPASPGTRASEECPQVRALPGWALGGRAAYAGLAQWTLPPSPVSGPAVQSIVRATVGVVLESPDRKPVPVTPARAADVAALLGPLAGTVVAGQVVTGPVKTPLTPTFDGWLWLPMTGPGESRQEVVQVATITLDQELTAQIELVLVATNDVRPRVEPAPAGVDTFLRDDGLLVWVFRFDDAPLQTIRLLSRPGDQERLGVVAVGGVSTSAQNAATAGQAGKPGVPGPVSTTPLLLRPGALHRVEVGWSGHAERLRDHSTNDSTGTDQRFFRIAPHSPGQPAGDLRTTQSEFHPRMLVRYLAGYGPGPDTPWFLDDPVSVTFTTATTVSLAATYGYGLELRVNRTDSPPGSGSGYGSVLLDWGFEKDPLLLSPYETVAVSAATCPTPTGTITGSGPAGLAPRASYDVAVLARPDATAPSPDHRVHEALPGVAFRTSLWASPAALLAALTSGVLHARVPAPALPSTPDASDAGFLGGLAALGLHLPPLASPTRTTVLWSGGHVVGLVLEADEPLERGSRLGDLHLQTTAGRLLPVMDRARTAALLLSPTPLTSLVLGWGERAVVVPGSSSPAWTTEPTVTIAVPATDPTALEVMA